MENKRKRSTVFIRREFPLPLSDSTKWGYTCRLCGTTWDNVTNYCPFCGRKVIMVVEIIKGEEQIIK